MAKILYTSINQVVNAQDEDSTLLDISMENQMKKADQSGARLAAILGEDEIERGEVTLKWLRESRDHSNLTISRIGRSIAWMAVMPLPTSVWYRRCPPAPAIRVK